MTQKQKPKQSKLTTSTSVYDNQKTGKFIGLKWYWWIAIIVGIFLVMGAISIMVGAFHPLSDLSKAALGFAAGIMNLLEHSGIFWFFAIIFVFPYLISGVSASVKLYKEHIAEGKSQKEVNQELKIDESGLQELNDKTKSENPGLPASEITKKAVSNMFQQINQETITKTQARLQSQVENGEISFETATANMEAMNQEAIDRNDKDAKDHGAEPSELEPGEVTKPVAP